VVPKGVVLVLLVVGGLGQGLEDDVVAPVLDGVVDVVLTAPADVSEVDALEEVDVVRGVVDGVVDDVPYGPALVVIWVVFHVHQHLKLFGRWSLT
jgi:hypothetical protein